MSCFLDSNVFIINNGSEVFLLYNSFDFICDKAEKLKAKYDETNPLKLARYMGIKVLFAPMGKSIECCKGFYLTHSRIKTMTINSDLSSDFQRIICSHELGHAVLHNKQAGVKAFHDFGLFDTASTFEYEANIFAAELLLEDEDVIERLNDDLSFFQAASELRVPAEILDFKFRTMKWKGYKIREAPLLSPGNWLKNAADGGSPDDYYGA